MNSNKAIAAPALSIVRMGDGSFHFHGKGKGGAVHMKPEMQDWRREDDEVTGEAFYVSFSQDTAARTAESHGLTIQQSNLS